MIHYQLQEQKFENEKISWQLCLTFCSEIVTFAFSQNTMLPKNECCLLRPLKLQRSSLSIIPLSFERYLFLGQACCTLYKLAVNKAASEQDGSFCMIMFKKNEALFPSKSVKPDWIAFMDYEIYICLVFLFVACK